MPKARSMNPFPFIFMFIFFHESNAAPHFQQAPKFHNSPDCPSIPPSTSICSPSTVHIAMTLDAAYLRGSMAAILSLLHHSSCPQNIAFHFIASASDSDLRHLISASFPYLHFHIYHFDDSVVSYFISTSIRPALDRPLNYARPYLATLLPPCVRRIVYLDSDVIVIDDIAKLADTDFGFSAVIAVAEHCTANFTSFFTPAFWSNPTLSLTFSGRRACYFNTGVMVIDLDRWRAGQYTARIEEWMELQKWMRIYELGSLPPFLLVFAGNIAAVDQRWNRNGLCRDDFSGQCPDMYPGPLSILHWSGKHKPWDRIDANRPCPLDSLWPRIIYIRLHLHSLLIIIIIIIIAIIIKIKSISVTLAQ